MMRRLGILVMMGIASTACMSGYAVRRRKVQPQKVIDKCEAELRRLKNRNDMLAEYSVGAKYMAGVSAIACGMSISSQNPVACCLASMCCVEWTCYSWELMREQDALEHKEKELNATIAVERGKIIRLSRSS